MIVLALVLLIIVLVFSVAIVVSNPDVYQLSLFLVLVPVTSAGVFFTGFGAALVTIIALLLLRAGIRRSRDTRRRLRSTGQSSAGTTASPGEDPSIEGPAGDQDSGTGDPDAEPADPPATSSLDLDSDEDRTTVPVDRRTAETGNDDRDEPRT
jgi:hypothetical protein